MQSTENKLYIKQAVRRRIRKALQVYIAASVLLLLFVVLVVINFIQGIYNYNPWNRARFLGI